MCSNKIDETLWKFWLQIKLFFCLKSLLFQNSTALYCTKILWFAILLNLLSLGLLDVSYPGGS